MPFIRRYFRKRKKYKLPMLKQRMRNTEVLFSNNPIVIKKDVKINTARPPALRLLPSHFLLDPFKGGQCAFRTQVCFSNYRHIYKQGLFFHSPRLGLIK